MRHLGRDRFETQWKQPVDPDAPTAPGDEAVDYSWDDLYELELISTLDFDKYGLEPSEQPLIHVLDELLATAQSVVDGRSGISKPDANSLANDLTRAIGKIGSELRKQVSVEVEHLLNDAKSLDTLLSAASGAHVLLGSAAALRAACLCPDGVEAAWRDAVAAIFQRRSSVLPFANLQTLVAANGHLWTDRRKHACGAIRDELSSIKRIRDGKATRDDLDKEAGLPREERLKFAGEWLSHPAARHRADACITLKNAVVPDGYLRISDSAELFDQATWELATSGKWENAPTDWRPPDLPKVGAEHEPLSFSHGANALLRLRLQAATFSDVVERAKESALEIIALADPKSSWALAGTVAVRLEDGSGTRSYFATEDLSGPDIPMLTYRMVESIRKDYVEAVCEGDHSPEIRLALDELRSARAISGLASVREQIVLAVRGLEHLLPLPTKPDGNGDWFDAADRYLLDHWVFATLLQQIWNSIDFVDGGKLQWYPPEIIELMGRIIRRDGDVHHRDLRQAMLNARGLTKARTPKSLAHGELMEIADVIEDPAQTARWLGRLRKDAQRLLCRTRRARNAIIHGTPVPEQALSQTAGFAIYLNELATHRLLDARVGREAPSAVFERGRNEDQRKIDHILGGGKLIDLLDSQD